jgi:hypothetical protein
MRSTRKAFAVLLTGAAVLWAGPGPAAERKEFQEWPAGTSPREIGKRVAEDFVLRPFERPTRFVIYPEVCTWYGGLTLAPLIGDTDLRDRLVRKFDHLLTPEGAKNISPAAHVDYRVFGAVPLEARYWIDDMYMITAVQVQAYRATGDAKYLDRAALAMVAYLDRLQQPDGLFFHAPDSRYYWSRGNGWMAAGTAALLRALPKKHPRHARILEGYQRMMASLLRYQGEDGLWRQLVDEPAAWPETSGTGMFTFAMVTGVKNGWLDGRTYGPAARKAWLGLVKHIDEKGNVREVCAGTNKGHSVEYYLYRPRNVGDLHGQAPVLWSASALLR